MPHEPEIRVCKAPQRPDGRGGRAESGANNNTVAKSRAGMETSCGKRLWLANGNSSVKEQPELQGTEEA